ncbi:MAG: endo-1,4-beta-xylanase [Spirochaetes bacterium]|nr:endo-1,4-beta-xylanase [Spirochaetota bacterium]MBN2769738.1 endo-1,4-beta-xylanase [Spirochaetota bacterium]
MNYSFFKTALLSKTVLFVLLTSVFISCSRDPLKEYDSQIETDLMPIKEFYKDDFPVGAAIEPFQVEKAEGALLRYHYNSITCENAMKFKSIHPKQKVYNFKAADRIVEFAKRYNMKMRGHTFVWHHPAEQVFWIFLNNDGSKRSRESVLELLGEHMQTLVDRYGDTIYAWDVVNEAIDIAEPDNMRKSQWYHSIGPDYVTEAFKLARKAAPDALLFYNDYDFFNPIKRDAIYDLVKRSIEQGAPIDGIGMQMHINNGTPTVESIEAAIEKFRDLGLQIHITEFDISMYAHEYDKFDSPSEEHIASQANRYKLFFQLFQKHKDIVTNVTFWGFNNGHTFLTGAPYNRPDWPFPFDENFQHTTAYKGIMQSDELPEYKPLLAVTEVKKYEAPKGTPVIDANIDAVWEKAPIVKTETIVVGDKPSIASVRVLWDKDYLYFLAEVEDSDLFLNAPEKYMNDSFEVFIDENNGKTPVYEQDDFQFRVDYENLLTIGGYSDSSMIKSAAKKAGKGYIVEARFKLQTVKAAPGLVMGLDFQVNQNDGSGQRTAIAKWNDLTNESWRSTAGWGLVELK